jgi:hypothetical protein
VGLTDRARLARLLAHRALVRRHAHETALQIQVGGLHARWVAQLAPDEIEKAEFTVFSQFGEDGIVQFLVQRVPIANHVFVELGVEDYTESNTRFLLVHDAWRGLIVDGGTAHRQFLEASELAWRTTVDAVTAFVDRDNVDDVIRGAGIEGDIGLLSVDIDGNDLWVLQSIESVSPRILVSEYNSLFGPDLAVSVPYDPMFRRSEKHYSHLYWGSSLQALASIAADRGYALVGGNRAGNNAFFIRRDVLGDIPERSVSDCWRPAQYRDSRSPTGQLTYLTDDRQKLRLLRKLPLVDLASGEETSVAALYSV